MRSPRLRAVLAAVHWGRCTRLALPHASSITGKSPGVVARSPPMSNQKCCAAPLRIMRQCCEAAMACVNTFLNCCVHATSSEARDARQRGFDACAFARWVSKKERMRVAGLHPPNAIERPPPRQVLDGVRIRTLPGPVAPSGSGSPSAPQNSVEMRIIPGSKQPPVRED